MNNGPLQDDAQPATDAPPPESGSDAFWAVKAMEAARKRPLAFAAWLALDVAVNKLIGVQDRLTDALRESAGT